MTTAAPSTWVVCRLEVNLCRAKEPTKSNVSSETQGSRSFPDCAEGFNSKSSTRLAVVNAGRCAFDTSSINTEQIMASRRQSLVGDDDHLAALGIQQELKRNFSPLSMLGLAFAILNSWTALSTSMSLALPSGGSTSVIWGLVTAGFFNLCLSASLAEFLSAYPTVSISTGSATWRLCQIDLRDDIHNTFLFQSCANLLRIGRRTIPLGTHYCMG